MGKILVPARKLVWILPPLAIVAAGVLAYRNSFAGCFLFDDERQIVDSRAVRGGWPSGGFFPLPVRPLVTWTLGVNYALGGLNTWGYHLVNLVIHLLAGLTLYAIARRTFLSERLKGRYGSDSTPLALAVALLWVVHPLQTESVTYLVQRAESLSGLLYLLTLYGVLRGSGAAFWGRLAWFSLAVVACGLGAYAKQTIVTAPLLVLLYDRIFLAGSWKELVRRRWPVYLGLAATWSLILLDLHWLFLAAPAPPGGAPVAPGPAISAGFATPGVSPADYARSQPGVVLHYLRLALWPDDLCLDYAWPVSGTADAAGPALVIALLLLATAWLLWRRPPLGYLGAWFFLTLAPTSSVVPLADLAFEHRMYLPLAAPLVLVVVGGYELLRLAAGRGWLRGGAARRVGAVAVLALALALAWRTARRNEDYRDPLTMWELVAAQRPQNARAQSLLGRYLEGAGRFVEAERHCRTAVALAPGSAEAHVQLGICLIRLRRLDEGEQSLRTAVLLKPDLAEAHNDLGACLAAKGRLAEAEGHLRQAVAGKPADAGARLNLGRCLLQQGKLQEAEAQLRELVRLQPDGAAAHYHLALCLAGRGEEDEAAEQFQAAARLDPRLTDGASPPFTGRGAAFPRR
jgi:Flp pilus assembly protein TadD